MKLEPHDMLEMSSAESKRQAYGLLALQWGALNADERDPLANLAQFSALVFQRVSGLNWTGFYLLRDSELVLGPFQGKVACTRIPLGRGVCGICAATRQVQIVPDVHAFDGHIACDSGSNAELVLPLVVGGRLVGVFDLDSPLKGRFDEVDASGLGAMLAILVVGTDWRSLTSHPGEMVKSTAFAVSPRQGGTRGPGNE